MDAARPVIVMDAGAPATLGELLRGRWYLHVYCRNPHCWRDLRLEWADLIRHFGDAAPFADTTFRHVVCRKCRRRDILWSAREPSVSASGSGHSNDGRRNPSYVDPPKAPVESAIDRYRRLTACDDMTVSPGTAPSIDDPVRPPCDAGPSLLDLAGWNMNDNRVPE